MSPARTAATATSSPRAGPARGAGGADGARPGAVRTAAAARCTCSIRSIGFLGGNGIIGAQIPLALGPAFAAKYRGDGRRVRGLLRRRRGQPGHPLRVDEPRGDLEAAGALRVREQPLRGDDAGAHRLPPADIAPRAAGFGMPAAIVDGQDVLAVYEVAGEAVARARAGEGPSFIEAKTYRFEGHCGAESDHAFPEECALWRERDPIELLRGGCWRRRLATEGELEQLNDGGAGRSWMRRSGSR